MEPFLQYLRTNSSSLSQLPSTLPNAHFPFNAELHKRLAIFLSPDTQISSLKSSRVFSFFSLLGGTEFVDLMISLALFPAKR